MEINYTNITIKDWTVSDRGFVMDMLESDLIQNYCSFMESEIFRILLIMIIAYLFIFITYHFNKDLGTKLEYVYFRFLFIPYSFFAGLIIVNKGFENIKILNIILFVFFCILLLLLSFNKNLKKIFDELKNKE